MHLRESHAFVATVGRQTLAVMMRRRMPEAMGYRVSDPHLLREQQHGSQSELGDQLAHGSL